MRHASGTGSEAPLHSTQGRTPERALAGDPQAVALDDGSRRWTRAEVASEAQRLADHFRSEGVRVMATLMDNSPAWVVADLAASLSGVVHVPMPVFFSPGQVAHVLRTAGVDTVLASPAVAAAAWPQASECRVAVQAMAMARLAAQQPALPEGTAKISFTSGTTGSPKGVCLSESAMQSVAQGLVKATEPLGIRRHLCVLPFAVLLENLAGLMAPLRQGATCVILPLRQLGLSGSSSFDPACFHAAVLAHQPHSMILLPQMLRAWAAYLAASGQRAPECLKLVAVGGAAVGKALIESARALGIPAHEGYGLSEGASVQSLNLPGADRPGSAGKALPHARLRIAPDGEVEVQGALFLGYLESIATATATATATGTATAPPPWWPTGDLGWIDADGFLHLHGRKKHVLITAFGRNVSPEWVETALKGGTAIANAAVFGDGQPSLSAVLWPVRDDFSDDVLQAAVDAANVDLPDYARVRLWVRGRAAFTEAAGMATANGRARREAVLALHADALGIAFP